MWTICGQTDGQSGDNMFFLREAYKQKNWEKQCSQSKPLSADIKAQTELK